MIIRCIFKKTLSRVVSLCLFAILTTSCADRYNEGYRDGKRAGYNDGYSAGERSGYKSGYESGKKDGYIEGYDEGKEKGITEGYIDGTKTFVENSIFPTLGTTIIVISSLIIALIIIYSFSKHFNKPIREYFNDIFLKASNLYVYTKLKERNFFLKRTMRSNSATQARIYSFDIYNDISNLTDDIDLDSEMLVIQSTIESYITEKLFENISKKSSHNSNRISEILNNKDNSLIDKNKLLNDVYIVLNKEISDQIKTSNLQGVRYRRISRIIRRKAKQLEIKKIPYYGLILLLMTIFIYFSIDQFFWILLCCTFFLN